jgi:hypothetical protein
MRLALLLVCLPALALAQTSSNTGLTLQVQGQSSQTVSGNDCGTDVQITWTQSLTGLACDNLTIWATTSSCGNQPESGDKTIAKIGAGTWSSQSSGTVTVAVSDLPLGAADGGTCGAAVEATINLCAATKVAGYLDCTYSTQTVNASPQATIEYDAKPPDAPNIASVEGSDGSLVVSVDVPGDAAFATVRYRVQGTTAWTTDGDVSSASPHLAINGLVNGTPYEVSAFAVDAAGNQSTDSAIVTGTPIETTGFWGNYQNGGGMETGGCSVGGAGGLLAGVLVALALLWRKR